MNIAGAIIVYLLIWWCVFFILLPQNVKAGWEDPDSLEKGHDPGAPQDPQIWEKVKRTSVIAAIAWLVVSLVIMSGVINFRP